MSMTDFSFLSLLILQKATSSTPNGIPSPRYGHCAALSTDGNTIIMFGGSLVANDKVTNDLYALDTRTWTWSQPALKTTPLSPVRDHQCVVIGDQFLSLFGFNANQAPSSTSSNSSGNSGSSTPIPSVPPIYVLSVSQWAWSTQYTPLPGTPSPPTPPSVPTNGSKNKVNGVAIAFGTIFGLAFLGVVGYLVFAHKRRQKRKAETLLLIEIQEQKKEEAKLEKERLQRQQQQQDAPLPPVPVSAHTNDNGNYQDYNDYNANYHGAGNQGGAFYPPVAASTAPSMSHYRATDPFQNPTYLQHQNSHHQLEPIPYYAQAGGSAAGEGLDLYPFAYPPPVSSQQQQDSPVFVPEEMGYISPMLPGSHNMPGNAADNFKVPVEDGRMGSGGRLASGARDKMSFIDPGPIYR
ncbi:hypothetical protein BC939DRAFT_252784 [Gamsiella multidivaricata]|uniref:uncharacterized protein n=1 Tax=Gamsiella multidivaricata TaxID=101098 RepID=UPI00221F3342|nr:uncharacterized protein BC939DRAFT_252784 [Gamsiella multidivaricata]KAI7819588.1 hypothetical protein BC939DRAFT_252784 [Gamsiella multidivaricata]